MKRALLILGFIYSQHLFADIVSYGAGSISDRINPDSYGCVIDHGSWINNAGVVAPEIDGCDPSGDYNGVPYGTPRKLYPQTVGAAAEKPTGTHRWWGSVAYYGEMAIGGDAAYITPDPIMARVSNRGVRILGIPAGLRVSNENEFNYPVPAPMDEVFDGIAIGNSQYSDLNAYMKDYSDGSITVEWRNGDLPVMDATFVYGSPYVYFDVFAGTPVIRSKSSNSSEKGIFYQQNNSLGVWTDVAGQRNYFLISGQANTSFNNIESNQINVNGNGRFTLTWLPANQAQTPDAAMIDVFNRYAQNRIDKVRIDYQVNNTSQAVTVSHHYLNSSGAETTTLAGLMPLQWKNTDAQLGAYKARSARGVVRFTETASFSYSLPFVGVLPTLPVFTDNLDIQQLKTLVSNFVALGEAQWNTRLDTYWTGKNIGKVAELAAIARSAGMTSEADRLINWLKGELEDWLTANNEGSLDTTKYFFYDSDWNTLLGLDESFAAHQQLNDHHFHYGYFVRAAAEICRVDRSWCGRDHYGPMIELLIRDYAAGRNDSMFPYLRNFDPANGFSWASGHARFALGNNNESTSEAANAYGAVILYGLITDNKELVDRGIYLHASSTAAYWEYWNNLDAYQGLTGDYNNFPSDYEKITTSIIWGAGGVFSTWFSPAYAHILGIQGLPLNPLVLHIGQHHDYLNDYVNLGLSQSANRQPSGLPPDSWSDIWWNILAMTDPQRAISDFNSVNFNYSPEQGETKAHTYHWIHTFDALGHIRSGMGDITADSPTAVVFEKNNLLTYLGYNFSSAQKTITFSDGMAMRVAPNSFGIKHSGDTPDTRYGDTESPTAPYDLVAVDISDHSVTLDWAASTDNIGIEGYEIAVSGKVYRTADTYFYIEALQPDTSYSVTLAAYDSSGNRSNSITIGFTTEQRVTEPQEPGTGFTGAISQTDGTTVVYIGITGWADIHYRINNGSQQNVSMPLVNGRRAFNISGLNEGDSISYWFTYQNPENPATAIDSETVDYSVSNAIDSGLPTGWTDIDIGTSDSGKTSYKDGVFTTFASGKDIWGSSDSFQFAYKTLNGDGTITAQVDRLDATDSWAKAGVMMRASLTPESQHAFTAITAEMGAAFQRRVAAGQESEHSAEPQMHASTWLRLTRTGQMFRAYVSSDGVNWASAGTQSIAMPEKIYVGIAHTAHDVNTFGTAAFSHVSVTSSLLLQAEDFINNYDLDASNNGGEYRQGSADIEVTTDTGGGYNLGWTQAGEWVEYPVTLNAGSYRICTRVASESGNAAYSIQLDNREIAVQQVNATGGWQHWITQQSPTFTVSAGNYSLRINTVSDNYNLNWIAITADECNTF